jgi:hypothetical protein
MLTGLTRWDLNEYNALIAAVVVMICILYVGRKILSPFLIRMYEYFITGNNYWI